MHARLALAVIAVVALSAVGCRQVRGAECTPDLQCEDGLACEERGDGTAVCVPPEGEQRLLREPCRATALCGPGVVCMLRDTGISLCLIEDGEFCFGDEECISNDCERRCSDTAVCDVGISCPCARDDDCGAGEACSGSECGRTCEPRAERGEVCITRLEGPCDFRGGCADGLECAIELGALADGVCLPPDQRAAGDLCNRDEECAGGSCVDAVCS